MLKFTKTTDNSGTVVKSVEIFNDGTFSDLEFKKIIFEGFRIFGDNKLEPKEDINNAEK